jgi:hypothetical protein
MKSKIKTKQSPFTKGLMPVMLMAASLLATAPAFADNGRDHDDGPPTGAGGGEVLPPDARPHGYSLADMAGAIAQFTTSQNQPQFFPKTPFQILYYDPSTLTFTTDVTGGITGSGRNSFTVTPGTSFYLPIDGADDSPPVLGVWPTDRRTARFYFFDPSQIGAKDFEVIVDGHRTVVGPSYLARPIETAPLQDGGGTHILTLGVFLSPMSVGTHSVTIRGGYYGALIDSTIGVPFYAEEFTYTVKVAPPERR